MAAGAVAAAEVDGVAVPGTRAAGAAADTERFFATSAADDTAFFPAAPTLLLGGTARPPRCRDRET